MIDNGVRQSTGTLPCVTGEDDLRPFGERFSVVTVPFVRGARATSGERRARTGVQLAGTPVRAGAMFSALAALVFRYTGQQRFALDRFMPHRADSVGFDLSGEMPFFTLTTHITEHRAAHAPGNALIAFVDAGARRPLAHAYDLIFSLDAASELTLEYPADRVDEQAPHLMLAHLAALVRAGIDDPNATLHDIDFFGDAERTLLLETINHTQRAFRDEPIIGRFNEIAAALPDAIALVVGNEQFTYADLAARSRRLARELIARGIGPGARVALCYERSSELIAATLAVMATGAAYVPLDPRNPARRQEQILTDASVDAILTEAAHAASFSAYGELVVRSAELDLAEVSAEPLPLRATPDDLAYVIFTSGSTGRPKGVMIDNRALAAFIDWTLDAFSDEELSGVLCASSIAFDVSVFELFAPLCRGGRTILVENILALHDAPARDDVRVVCSVASGLRELLAQGPLPAGVRTVMQAGERLHAATARTLLGHRDVRLLNLCGGTEDTVYSVWQPVTSAQADPPIGRPFSNHQVYVVDEQLRPVPSGVPGEICYAGPGVARGYINRPDETARRFVPNPFGGSALMYRSGDLVRWNARGELEFLQRLDDQLKVRGQRVELAEIEHHLLEAPGVAQALVVPFDDGGDIALAAYLIPARTPAPAQRSAPAAQTAHADDADVVDAWRTVYDDLYSGDALAAGDDFRGWVDRAGVPFARAEMQQWADAIAALVLRRSPASVLEIGCGNGLIARRVAPHVARYTGIDLSPAAVAHVADSLRGTPHVELAFAALAADELDRLPAERFDVVLINSVVQYFPSRVYFDDVIRAASARLAPGGRLVVGDLRNPRIAGTADDRELLVDPAHLAALAGEIGDLDCSLLGRIGHGPAELARERYDAVLERAQREPLAPVEVPFTGALHSAAAVVRLAALLTPPLAVNGVPDRRFDADGVDLAAVRDALHAQGLHLEIAPPDAGTTTLLITTEPRVRAFVPAPYRTTPTLETQPVLAPARSDAARDADVRAFLAQRLPQYMIPSRLVWIDAFPHNASGKIDRAALPAPALSAAASRTLAEPRSENERIVLAAWREVLKRDDIGVDDDLFALGGHSLTAARIIARLRDRAPSLSLSAFFAEPTPAALARMLAPDAAQIAPAAPTSAASDATLSFAQETMWFLDRVLPDASVYNVPLAWQLRGEIDLAALETALNGLAQRHAQLRTAFPDIDGVPVARTNAAATIPLRRVSLAGRDPADVLTAEARVPFALEHGPLIRALLLEAGDATTLLVTYHHIIADGWARTVLARDFYEFYAAARERRAPQLPELTVSYAEYARSEREAESLYESDLRWWSQQLRDLPRFDIVGERVPPAVRTVRGGRVEQRLSAAQTARLRVFAERNRTTPFAVTLAAYAAFLARYSGEREIVIGTPLAGRRYVELDPLVGNFIEMVTLRLTLEAAADFGDAVRVAQQTLLEALDHQTAPFRLVVERVASMRSQAQNPLFSVAIVAQDAVPAGDAAGTRFAPYDVHTGTSKFDLLLEVITDGDDLRLGVEFARDRFDAPFVESLLVTFRHLLDAVLEAPQTPLDQIPLTAASATAAHALQIPPATAVNLRFRAHANEQPQAIALRSGETLVSYGALAAHADALRAQLSAAGVRRGDLVGICALPSPALLAAIIATLDIGAAYVPLDPRYPARRLAYVAADSGIVLALTDDAGSAALAELDVRTIAMHDAADTATAQTSLPAPLEVAPQDAAYVIYTSGSTGNPKGVVVEHGNVARLFAAAGRRFSFSSRDTWTLFHSPAFDFSVWEIWGALAHGGTLVIVAPEIARSPAEFYRLVAAHGVTVLNQTPAAFYAFDEIDAVERAPLALRYVVFGGEALEAARLAGWIGRHGERAPQLVNMYGITETTVHVTSHVVSADDELAPYSRIGTPLDDLAVELLDRAGQPVPAGFIGEMFVLGAGVARAYLGNPRATADRFSQVDGVRRYRSGDLARRRISGDLEYAGRIDQQLKVRGFRVEPGEIEAALIAHPAISRAVVLADRHAGDTRLIAYVVPADASARVPDLRAFLALSLPAYMLPSAFVPVRALPLTANGKLDRRALAAVEFAAEPETAEPAGASNLELEVQALFQEMLGVAHVGLNESFFALGGHSLLAARLAARLETRFPAAAERFRQRDGRGALLRVFYHEPTIRALAATLEGGGATATPIVCMRAGDADVTPVFWLHGMFNGDGLYAWDILKQLPESVPFYVVHPHGYDNQQFPADIGVLADEHIAMIREVRPHGPYVIGGFCNGALVALEIAQRLRAAGEDVERLVLVSLPPLYVVAEQLHRAWLAVTRRLGLPARANTVLLRHARYLNERVLRLLNGSMHDRVMLVRRAFARIGSVRAAVADDRFAQPDFKHAHYVRAMTSYALDTYAAPATLVFGDEVQPGARAFRMGWATYLPDATLATLPGGHFCVVDSAELLGTILARALDQKPNWSRS